MQNNYVLPIPKNKEQPYTEIPVRVYNELIAGGISPHSLTLITSAALLFEGTEPDLGKTLGDLAKNIHGESQTPSITERRAIDALVEAGLVTRKGFTSAQRYTRVKGETHNV